MVKTQEEEETDWWTCSLSPLPHNLSSESRPQAPKSLCGSGGGGGHSGHLNVCWGLVASNGRAHAPKMAQKTRSTRWRGWEDMVIIVWYHWSSEYIVEKKLKIIRFANHLFTYLSRHTVIRKGTSSGTLLQERFDTKGYFTENNNNIYEFTLVITTGE